MLTLTLFVTVSVVVCILSNFSACPFQRILFCLRRRSVSLFVSSSFVNTANSVISVSSVNPLMGTLKPQSNGPLYSNTVIGTLAVDRVHGLLHLVQRGWASAGWGPAQFPPRCIKCNSPPIKGQCTHFILFDAAL